MADITNVLQSLATPLTSLILVIGALAIAFRSLRLAENLVQLWLKMGLPTTTLPAPAPAPQKEPPPPFPEPSHPAPAPAPVAPPAPPSSHVPTSTPNRFAECMAFVWPEEGGLSNDKEDHGGLTNLGVTLPDLERAGLPATADELKSLTKDKAASLIYRPFYWNALHCDELPAGVDLEVFDLGINAGIHEAAKLLQRDVGTKEDGVIGPLTISAAHAKNPLDTINTFNTERITFYRSLKQFDRFGRDWLRRSADCFALATKMAKS